MGAATQSQRFGGVDVHGHEVRLPVEQLLSPSIELGGVHEAFSFEVEVSIRPSELAVSSQAIS